NESVLNLKLASANPIMRHELALPVKVHPDCLVTLVCAFHANTQRRLSTEHFINRTTDYGLDNELRLEGDERSARANVTVNLTCTLSLVICGFLTTSLN